MIILQIHIGLYLCTSSSEMDIFLLLGPCRVIPSLGPGLPAAGTLRAERDGAAAEGGLERRQLQGETEQTGRAGGGGWGGATTFHAESMVCSSSPVTAYPGPLVLSPSWIWRGTVTLNRQPVSPRRAHDLGRNPRASACSFEHNNCILSALFIPSKIFLVWLFCLFCTNPTACCQGAVVPGDGIGPASPKPTPPSPSLIHPQGWAGPCTPVLGLGGGGQWSPVFGL